MNKKIAVGTRAAAQTRADAACRHYAGASLKCHHDKDHSSNVITARSASLKSCCSFELGAQTITGSSEEANLTAVGSFLLTTVVLMTVGVWPFVCKWAYAVIVKVSCLIVTSMNPYS